MHEKYIDKIILIGISFISKNNQLIEEYQTHGKIKDIEEDRLMRIERNNLSTFTIPFDEEAISKAEKGIYKEKATGIEIENPDYISSWTIIKQSKEENFENTKKYGFGDPIS